MGELAEQHRNQLGPAAKAFGAPFGIISLDQRCELGSRKMLEQLIEETRDLYYWIALLWQRLARLPARNGSPPSIIGGHSPYFRLQEPVLDKSETT
jgi:hypothetical protein